MADQIEINEDTIEAMVDKHGLQEVIGLLVCVCYSKANHLEEAWQDKTQSKAWSKAAQALLKAENAVPSAIRF